MEDDEDIPPFWLQNTAHGRRPRRHQVSSFFLSSGVFLVLLLIIAFFLVFVIIPSFISFTSQIFRPHLIKKGWDSLNLVLVVFAIVCGFLNINRNNNNESPNYDREQNLSNNGKQEAPRSYPETPPRWYDQFQQDRTPRLSRLRSFSSYPDLRQESSWITNDERWRFYDDTHINNYRLSSSDQINPGPPLQLDQEAKKPEVHQEHDEVLERTETKDIVVDTVVSGQDKEVVYSPPSPPPIQSPPPPPAPPSRPPPPRSPPQPPPPSSKVVKRKVKRTYQDVERERDHRRIEKELEVKNLYIPPPSPPPPPPPPPPVFSKSEKRRGKDFLISLRRRRKKQRQKSVENLESFFNLETSLPSLIPPPPPPPPPPHFFQNLFSSKKGKTKKTHSVPPPPPPPPPRAAVTTRVEARASRTKSQVTSVVTTHEPPRPLRTTSAGSVEDNVESGNASPLRPIPPPPPPPPFKIPAWKFVLDGDYVRVRSFNSSRSGSPDLESVEDQSDKESSPMAGNNGGGEPVAMPLFCPSPDVNTKADNFIARFRAGLRMEKMNSVKGRSNLGPEASFGPETEEQ